VKKVFPLLLILLIAATGVYAAKAKTTTVSGTLEKMGTRMLTVKDQKTNESKDFALNESTQYSINNKKSNQVTLKVGDKVTIESTAKNVAVRVNVEQTEAGGSGL